MSSPSAVPCREIFDENSQPSAEEISEYAQQLGIDPDSESHLLPLARDGLMQALPAPWKAYFDEKLQTHYYYNEDTKKTQWEHPLDNVYRELVKKARDSSIVDDTCASVQELLTFEENTKHLERGQTKVDSDDDDLFTDSELHASDNKDPKDPTLVPKNIRLAPLGRPPVGRPSKLERRLTDLKINPKIDYTKLALRTSFERDLSNRTPLERPKLLFKQQSEIIDLKMLVLNSPEEDNFSPLLSSAKIERGLPFQGRGNQYFRVSKSDLPSPDTDKSLPLDSITKSDPPKGILREKISDSLQRKAEDLLFSRQRHSASLDEDRKSVRFKLETLPDPTISPGSNSSSEQNDQNSIASAPPPAIPIPSPVIPSSPVLSPVKLNPNTIVLSPLVHRPPLPPRPLESPREVKSFSGAERESLESDRGTSPRRRVVRPPAADYIKPDLFQKSFQKISDLVRPGDAEPCTAYLEEPVTDKEARPRSPMIPQQKNKISINLMESIESETSIDSPDKEFANLDLNDLDVSNENNNQKDSAENGETKDTSKEENSEKATISKTSNSTQNRSPVVAESIPIPQIKVPKLDLAKPKSLLSDSEDSKKLDDFRNSKSESIEIKTQQVKVSPTPSLGSDIRSPRYDFSKPWSNPLSTFKPPLNKAVIAPLKSSESASSLGKGLSPRLDGVILSQGKSSSDNVVVVYQFENTQEEIFPKPIKSPLIPDVAARDMLERNKADERRRLELSLQKELENIRVEWCAKERRMRAELQEELREAEEKFVAEKKFRLEEQTAKHKLDMEKALELGERDHEAAVEKFRLEMEERRKRDIEAMERKHSEDMDRLHEQYQNRLTEKRQQLEIENDRALSELQEQFQVSLHRERTRLSEENRSTIQTLREEHAARVADLRTDYRAEVDRIRTQHACHLEELRARLATERTAPRQEERALAEKYKCLKEKYARLKHDVKMSIERRNKRREMSMTTGSETEKSNSNKGNQSLERCKELHETSVSAVIEPEPRVRSNNNTKYNDNETSHSESNANNNENWRTKRENNIIGTPHQTASKKHRRTAVAFREPPARSRTRERDKDGGICPSLSNISHQTTSKKHRRTAVAFREPPARSRTRERDKDGAVTTDCQDSSDATTADEKPKEPINGHGRRRCFTRLKSASTSRLNYSPKRGEGWSSPLESLRQQLRKLDDLEDQFPDLACQPAYSLRYPFAELGTVSRAEADTPELEFVRHRALVEREGMRRARAVLKRRRAALRETRASLSPHRAPSEEREVTELEVALHRARALLGEKEIRLRHIERALRKLTDAHYDNPPLPTPTLPTAPLIQEATTSEASSGSEGVEVEATSGAVLRSLRALHADVRDIWRALEVKPTTGQYTNMTTTSFVRQRGGGSGSYLGRRAALAASPPRRRSEGVEVEATSGAVLRSLRALHADVRDIWRALEVKPTTGQYTNMTTTSFVRQRGGGSGSYLGRRAALAASPPRRREGHLARARGEAHHWSVYQHDNNKLRQAARAWKWKLPRAPCCARCEPSTQTEGVEVEATSGAVLRSLRALHANVRDIWGALEVKPTTGQYTNMTTTSFVRVGSFPGNQLCKCTIHIAH
ncbi:hypothetical protein O0L34_g13768 [Tuta absoluta]|nr:hypothetical protein O0L34_g13768 [Tuta absoluta]